LCVSLFLCCIPAKFWGFLLSLHIHTHTCLCRLVVDPCPLISWLLLLLTLNQMTKSEPLPWRLILLLLLSPSLLYFLKSMKHKHFSN
jgi:hypothetical protein